MSLASPWGLLALLGIPLILYFHRRTPARRLMVPLVSLWKPGAAPAAEASRRRRLDPLLLLRLLIVIGIAVALARPGWPAPGPRRHVIVLDASASMGTQEDAGVRFRRALDGAARLLDQLPPGDEVMILRGGTPPTLAHAFSTDRRALRRALDALAPGQASKDLSPALVMAEQALAGKAGVVRVFSDIREPESLARLARRLGIAPEALTLHRVGGPADNVAIVGLAAAPLPQSPLDHELFVEVANFSSRPRVVELGLYVPEGRREHRRLSIAPWERKPVMFSAPPAPWIEVKLEGAADALAVDDRAVLVLSAAPLRVLYASRGDRFVDAALDAHPRLLIRRIPVARLGTEPWSSRTADVAVVDGARLPPGFPLPALVFLPPGPGERETARAVPVVDWQRSHPLLRQLDLSEVLAPAGAVLPSKASGILIRSADGPIARASVGPGPRRVEMAFPVDRSNLGRTPAFPVLMARVLDWLADHGTAAPLTVGVGEPLRITLPDAPSAGLTVHRPDGSAVRVIGNDGALDFTGTDLAGRYEVEGLGVRLPFAANLLDPEESNVDRAGVATADRAPAPSAGATGWRDLSRWVLAVALPLLSLEIWLVQRRTRRVAR